MKNGGKRPGAGRPVGSTQTTKFRKLLIEFFSENEENRELYLSKIREKLDEGDARILTWLGDQLAGKAPQPMEFSGGITNTQYVITRGEEDQSVPTPQITGGDSKGSSQV